MTTQAGQRDTAHRLTINQIASGEGVRAQRQGIAIHLALGIGGNCCRTRDHAQVSVYIGQGIVTGIEGAAAGIAGLDITDVGTHRTGGIGVTSAQTGQRDAAHRLTVGQVAGGESTGTQRQGIAIHLALRIGGYGQITWCYTQVSVYIGQDVVTGIEGAAAGIAGLDIAGVGAYCAGSTGIMPAQAGQRDAAHRLSIGQVACGEGARAQRQGIAIHLALRIGGDRCRTWRHAQVTVHIGQGVVTGIEGAATGITGPDITGVGTHRTGGIGVMPTQTGQGHAAHALTVGQIACGEGVRAQRQGIAIHLALGIGANG